MVSYLRCYLCKASKEGFLLMFYVCEGRDTSLRLRVDFDFSLRFIVLFCKNIIYNNTDAS